MSTGNQYDVLMATRRGSSTDSNRRLPELDHVPAPWETNLQATCECLSWRGRLDNLDRRQAEDELGDTVYAEFPVHARSVLVTAHSLMDLGEISEDELEGKMKAVRARFESAP